MRLAKGVHAGGRCAQDEGMISTEPLRKDEFMHTSVTVPLATLRPRGEDFGIKTERGGPGWLAERRW